MLTLKFKVHSVTPVDDSTVRGVFAVPDYEDQATREALGLAKGQKDASKLLIGELAGRVGEEHAEQIVAGREVTLTLAWGAMPVEAPVKDTGAKKRKKKGSQEVTE